MKGLPVLVFAALALSSCATLATRPPLAAIPPEGEPHWQPLAQGIAYASFASSNPRVECSALRVDLKADGLEPVVTPCVKGISSSQYVTSFVRATDCSVAVNASPFRPSSAREGEGRTVVGLTMADGALLSPPQPPMAVLFLERDEDGGLVGEVALQTEDVASERGGRRIVAAVGGFSIVLPSPGETVSPGDTASPSSRAAGSRVSASRVRESREPRTAAGLSSDGRTLYLLVADGRRRDSVGLTNREAGLWLSWLGAERGMTFDGGGSTAMAIRGPEGQVRLANVPIDAGRPGRERAVGSCLGFRAKPKK